MPQPTKPTTPPKRPPDILTLVLTIILCVMIFGAAFFVSQKHSTQETNQVWVAQHDFAAYHQVDAVDMALSDVAVTEVPDDALPAAESPSNHYIIQPLATGDILRDTQVVMSDDPALQQDTTIVSVTASAGAAFNGQLKSGAEVTLWSVSSSSATIITPNALVLASIANPYTFSLVLVIPRANQEAVLMAAFKSSLVFTLSP